MAPVLVTAVVGRAAALMAILPLDNMFITPAPAICRSEIVILPGFAGSTSGVAIFTFHPAPSVTGPENVVLPANPILPFAHHCVVPVKVATGMVQCILVLFVSFAKKLVSANELVPEKVSPPNCSRKTFSPPVVLTLLNTNVVRLPPAPKPI